MKNIKKEKKSKQNKEKIMSEYNFILKGVVIAYLITTISFITYGLLLTYTNITGEKLQLVVMLTTVLSVFVGGFLASRSVSKRGLVYGMLVGFLYALIMIMIGFCVMPIIKFTSKMVMLLVLSISAGGISGIIGINTKKDKKIIWYVNYSGGDILSPLNKKL